MGRQIARLRKENRFTQEQLAEILNISPQAVSKWENAKAVPEVSTIYELSRLFNCSVDKVLDPSSSVSRNMDFDYELLIKPRVPVVDYSGPEWPKSISSAALLTALKLFFGLELRRDGKNCQINDDEEYILQSALTNICFGYSYAPEEWPHDSFLIYGLDYELHPQSVYSENAFIELACRQIEHGYPVIIRPREYTDTIFAIGFSNHGKTLKGLGFLDGDDQKNRVDFSHLNQYTGWYKSDCDMMTVKLSQKTMPLVKACANAFLKGDNAAVK